MWKFLFAYRPVCRDSDRGSPRLLLDLFDQVVRVVDRDSHGVFVCRILADRMARIPLRCGHRSRMARDSSPGRKSGDHRVVVEHRARQGRLLPFVVEREESGRQSTKDEAIQELSNYSRLLLTIKKAYLKYVSPIWIREMQMYIVK